MDYVIPSNITLQETEPYLSSIQKQYDVLRNGKKIGRIFKCRVTYRTEYKGCRHGYDRTCTEWKGELAKDPIQYKSRYNLTMNKALSDILEMARIKVVRDFGKGNNPKIIRMPKLKPVQGKA